VNKDVLENLAKIGNLHKEGSDKEEIESISTYFQTMPQVK